MTYDERTVVRRDVDNDLAHDRDTSVSKRTVEMRPSGGTIAGRLIVLVFAVIQAVILLRIVLLALDARQGNDLVAFILNSSQVFVGPFEGILRSDGLRAGGSFFDGAALLALIGWTLLEALILAAVGVFRREPA
jgi:hypothetical protein